MDTCKTLAKIYLLYALSKLSHSFPKLNILLLNDRDRGYSYFYKACAL